MFCIGTTTSVSHLTPFISFHNSVGDEPALERSLSDAVCTCIFLTVFTHKVWCGDGLRVVSRHGSDDFKKRRSLGCKLRGLGDEPELVYCHEHRKHTVPVTAVLGPWREVYRQLFVVAAQSQVPRIFARCSGACSTPLPGAAYVCMHLFVKTHTRWSRPPPWHFAVCQVTFDTQTLSFSWRHDKMTRNIVSITTGSARRCRFRTFHVVSNMRKNSRRFDVQGAR